MNNISQKEYIEDINKSPDKESPCIVCHRLDFQYCRDNEMECKAFRAYLSHNSYKDSYVGVDKRPSNVKEGRFYV